MKFLKYFTLIVLSIVVLSSIYIFTMRHDLKSRIEFVISSSGLLKTPQVNELIPHDKNLALYFSTGTLSKEALNQLLKAINDIKPLMKKSLSKEIEYIETLNQIVPDKLDSSNLIEEISKLDSYEASIKTIQDQNKLSQFSFSFGALVENELNINLTQRPGSEILDSLSFFATVKYNTNMPLIGLMIAPEKAKEFAIKELLKISQTELTEEKKLQNQQIIQLIQNLTLERLWSKGYPVLSIKQPMIPNVDLYLAVVGQDNFILSTKINVLTKILDRNQNNITDKFINQLNTFTKNKLISLSLNVNSILEKSPQLAMMGRMFIKSLNFLNFDFNFKESIETSLNANFEKIEDVNFFKQQLSSMLNSQVQLLPKLELFEPEITSEKNQLSIQSSVEIQKLVTEFSLLINEENIKKDNQLEIVKNILQIKKQNNFNVIALNDNELNDGQGILSNEATFMPINLNSLSTDKNYNPKYLLALANCSPSEYNIKLFNNKKLVELKSISSENNSIKFNTDNSFISVFEIINSQKSNNFKLQITINDQNTIGSCSFKQKPFLLTN